MQEETHITLLLVGLIKEEINKGTFKRFQDTQTQVYSIEVTDEQYNNINNILKEMYDKKDVYKFNFLGLSLVSLHKRIERENYFYCAEFVRYVLESADIDTRSLPSIIKPGDFKALEGLNLKYEGLLRKFPNSKEQIT